MDYIKTNTYHYRELAEASPRLLKAYWNDYVRRRQRWNWDVPNSDEAYVALEVCKWQLLLWSDFRVYIHRTRRLFKWKWGQYIAEMKKEYNKQLAENELLY